MGKYIAILIALVVALTALGLMWRKCGNELRDCRQELDACQAAPPPPPAPPAAAFLFVIERDAFGTFMPFNNQYDPATFLTPDVFRGGYFVQLGDFVSSNHRFDLIKLQHADGTESVHNRYTGGIVWVDVVCGSNTSQPITPPQAGQLVPENVADRLRLIHGDILNESSRPIVLATLWSGAQGIEATAKAVPVPTGSSHGHDEYTFSSVETCTVRLWSSFAAGATPVHEFGSGDSDRVTEIRVVESSAPATHGGPHTPPWGTPS